VLSSTPLPWYASKAIWGNIVAVGGIAFALTQHHILSQVDVTTITDDLTMIGTALASLYSIYGRIMATQKIG